MELSNWLLVIWPIGVPLCFWGLLARAKEGGPLSRAVSFLHSEYRPEWRQWEIGESIRKIAVTSLVFLIPQQYFNLRLVSALLVSIAHTVLLTYAMPYQQASTALVAVIVSVVLQCTLLFALLIQAQMQRLATFENTVGLVDTVVIAAIMVGFTASVVAVAFALFLYQLRIARQQLLRVTETGRLPTLALKAGKRWHLFLSHK